MRHASVYTHDLPPMPSTVGTWIRLDRIARQGERVLFKVTYENAVGGQVAHRFNSLQLATRYLGALMDQHLHLKALQGGTVSH